MQSKELLLLNELIKYIDWTDHNTPDPGITFLEAISYVQSDLDYRSNFLVQDLFHSLSSSELLSIAAIAPTAPTTLLDYRKLLIDLPGVADAWLNTKIDTPPYWFVEIVDGYENNRLNFHTIDSLDNADEGWIRITPKGLYEVNIVPEKPLLSEEDENSLILAATTLLNANRNLSEDFIYIQVLQPEIIQVEIEILVEERVDGNQILANVYDRLSRYISPRFSFATRSELEAENKPLEQIFDGPTLQHGFLRTTDLEQFQRLESVRSSDILQEIMKEPGVIAVRDILLSKDNGNTEDEWILPLDSLKAPVLDLPNFATASDLGIKLFHKELEVVPNVARVGELYQAKQQIGEKQIPPISERDRLISPGRDRQVGRYKPLQDELPANYGVGQRGPRLNGLKGAEKARQQAKAKQLKAYLLFFDQIFAQHFAQLAQVSSLLSFSDGPSYFHQLPERVAGYSSVLKKTIAEHLQQIADFTEDKTTRLDRKNRLLDYLLARFGEDFSDYALVMKSIHQGTEESLAQRLIDDKVRFLNALPILGKERAKAYDYTIQPLWDTDNVSGLKKRISYLLGIPNYERRSLTPLYDASDPESGEEGFHFIEHILLRPGIGENNPFQVLPEGSEIVDPFSLWLSFIFPNFIGRFRVPEFQEFVKRIVRRETPAHIQIRIFFLDEPNFADSEQSYRNYLNQIAGNS